MEIGRSGGGSFTQPRNDNGRLLRIGVDSLTDFSNTSAVNTATIVDRLWRDKVFVFDAQRLSLGRSPYGYEETIRPNASNLAAVLSRLRGEQSTVFNTLVGHVQEIFTTVRGISVTPTRRGDQEIRVWATDDQLHVDMSVGLDDSGTGISQALAILTVAITQSNSVIVIDEINAFLHPAAAKRMVRILLENYGTHQYIMSTHSPELFGVVPLGIVHNVKKYGYQSSVETISSSNIESLRAISTDLGVSLSDFLVADKIIWVEGPTEELIFGYLYRSAFGQLPAGLAFLPIVATGDFQRSGERTDLILEIYRRLGEAAVSTDRTTTFSFDRELLSDLEMSDLTRRARGRAKFLSRRNVECYLLHVEAISQFLSENCPDIPDVNVAVSEALYGMAGERAYGGHIQWQGDLRSEEWLRVVDAAKLIRDVCRRVTDGRIFFSKHIQSAAIVRIIWDLDPEHLSGLLGYVQSLIALATDGS